ncbi:hypothetical protein Taro_038749 [Colocasia esculenta]|uniref:EIF2B subunit epsilon/gamma LbH domain-containing protein n=1 Tax=Colocasia esculenta TaxID=4460 RepID=A0A843W8W8_COLES|nr:hypothetical protein [Colocasia esculenta]
MEVRVDLMDAHLYAFKRIVLQEVLEQKNTFESIQRDVLPYLVRSQLRSEVSAKGIPQEEEGWNGKTTSEIQTWISQHNGGPAFPDPQLLNSINSMAVPRTHKCCAYIANKNKYCVRLNSIQAFSDINRDVIGEASHISGYSFSAQSNIIHPSSKHGIKTTIGQHCMISEGSQLGDKCNVKRSVIGRHCRIGSNVKIVNSVVMNHVSIEDGCTVQGSVICSNVQLQEGCVLRDCQCSAIGGRRLMPGVWWSASGSRRQTLDVGVRCPGGRRPVVRCLELDNQRPSGVRYLAFDACAFDVWQSTPDARCTRRPWHPPLGKPGATRIRSRVEAPPPHPNVHPATGGGLMKRT